MSNELSESEVVELIGTIVDKTACAILMREVSQQTTIASLKRKFLIEVKIISILIQLTNKIVQTGRKQLCNCQISPRHLQLLPQNAICLSSYYIKCCIQPHGTMAI
jgi:hypothetical protein